MQQQKKKALAVLVALRCNTIETKTTIPADVEAPAVPGVLVAAIKATAAHS